jgi:hypothetical protein
MCTKIYKIKTITLFISFCYRSRLNCEQKKFPKSTQRIENFYHFRIFSLKIPMKYVKLWPSRIFIFRNIFIVKVIVEKTKKKFNFCQKSYFKIKSKNQIRKIKILNSMTLVSYDKICSSIFGYSNMN